MKFKLNLIREIQTDRKTREKSRKQAAVIVAICFSILAATSAVSFFDVLRMRDAVMEERQRLLLVKSEYQRYTTASMIVNKDDVELLDRLQSGRHFWTKKLQVLAYYLPDDYWITMFEYDRKLLRVDGYGYITERQEQLNTLHGYLNSLRRDSLFNDVFRTTHLNSAVRHDDLTAKRERVQFSFSGTEASK